MLRLTRTTTIIAAILIAVLATGSPARADEVEIPTELEEEWYGWQVLAADATGILATAGCVLAVQEDACFLPYLAAAPMVHLSRRRATQALASLGLRVALPLAGALIGLSAASCGEQTACGVGEIAGGVFIGVLTASLIDAFALSDGGHGATGHRHAYPHLVPVAQRLRRPQRRVVRAARKLLAPAADATRTRSNSPFGAAHRRLDHVAARRRLPAVDRDAVDGPAHGPTRRHRAQRRPLQRRRPLGIQQEARAVRGVDDGKRARRRAGCAAGRLRAVERARRRRQPVRARPTCELRRPHHLAPPAHPAVPGAQPCAAACRARSSRVCAGSRGPAASPTARTPRRAPASWGAPGAVGVPKRAASATNAARTSGAAPCIAITPAVGLPSKLPAQAPTVYSAVVPNARSSV